MSSYGPLARWYDDLTGDVPYEAFADYYRGLFDTLARRPVQMVLDLACGTGTLTWLLAEAGFETIGVDASPEMLSAASDKAGEVRGGFTPPLFLCQEAARLDLYGTVDAAVCSLDGMNYLPPRQLPRVFARLALFVAPGGMVAFDLVTPERLKSLDGQVFVDETEDVLCLWRAGFDEKARRLLYGMDLFERQGDVWRREREEHVEYAHEPEKIAGLLAAAGFEDVSLRKDGPEGDKGRIFITGIRS